MTTAPAALSHAPSPAPSPGLFVPAGGLVYLQRAASSLQEAITSDDVGMRYAHAHVAALRTTAALLAARATPFDPQSPPGRSGGPGPGRPPVRAGGTRRRGPVQRNAWVLLAQVAPEFAEWAAFFAAGAAKRAAAEAGSQRAVTEREADDLVRDADRFLGLVEESLGMTRHLPLSACLTACSAGSSGLRNTA